MSTEQDPQPRRRKVGNPLALAVLAELLMGPIHPYEIGRRLKEHGKDRSFKYNRSSLYMVVEQLRRAGFIDEHETVRDTQRPERTLYSLTDPGREELFDWMRELVAIPQPEYPHFGVALSLLSILVPAEAVDLLGRRLEALDAAIDETQATVAATTHAGVPWVFLVEEDYRLAVIGAERRFVAGLAEKLGDPEYVRTWHETFGGNG
jgi:DNA-binding PadR family transcriptional regulator